MARSTAKGVISGAVVVVASYACSSPTVRESYFAGLNNPDASPPPRQCDTEFPKGACTANDVCQFTQSDVGCMPGVAIAPDAPPTWTCKCDGAWSCNVTGGAFGVHECPDAGGPIDASDVDADADAPPITDSGADAIESD